MLMIVILSIVILASLAYIIYVILKHLPDLKILDIKSISEENEIAIKTRILRAKLTRQNEKFKEGFNKILLPQKNFLANKFKNLKERVVALEKKYQFGKEGAKDEKPKTKAESFQEAENLISKQEYNQAEKILIEIIAKDKKNTKAYELLGNLYFKNKSYEQSEEIFKHLIKLSSIRGSKESHSMRRDQLDAAEVDLLNTLNVSNRVAAYYDNLGLVYEVAGKDEKAQDCYLKAISIEPNNPKYLDKLIEFSIRIGDKSLARRTLGHLKKINPENAKLGEIQDRIEKIQ